MRPPALNEEQAAKLYEEYCLWLSLAPKKLCAKHGISRNTFRRYVEQQRKRAA